MKTIITKVENNRVVKFTPVNDKEAEETLDSIQKSYPSAFIYNGEYLPDLWVEGNIVIVKEYEESGEQIIARLESVIESHIASVITGMGYVSLERLVVYQNSTNTKWKAEALAAPLWVTAIWETALSIMNEVQSGLREVPTEAELLALMPKLEDFITY